MEDGGAASADVLKEHLVVDQTRHRFRCGQS